MGKPRPTGGWRAPKPRKEWPASLRVTPVGLAGALHAVAHWVLTGVVVGALRLLVGVATVLGTLALVDSVWGGTSKGGAGGKPK